MHKNTVRNIKIMTRLTKEEQKAASNYNKACQKAHENVSEDTNTRIKKTLTLKQCLMILLLFSGFQYITTTSYGRWHSGHWFWEHAAIQKSLTDLNDTLTSDNIVLREGLHNAKLQKAWLWHSHNLGVALVVDDPKQISVDAWEWIKKTYSTARMNGLMNIINDSNHPNLAKWAQGNYMSREALELKLAEYESLNTVKLSKD